MGLKNKFCPKCGKETTSLINGLCSKCYNSINNIKIPKSIKLTICKRCGSILVGNKWFIKNSWKEHIIEKLSKKIKTPPGVELENIKIVELGEEGKVRLWFSINGDIFTESREISIIVSERFCKECSIKKRKLWNSKLQLRVENKIMEEILKKLPKDYVIKVKPVTNGVDIYFSDKDTGKSFARKLKNRYQLKSKSSFEQRGWDKSKDTSYKMPVILLKNKIKDK